jgi:hypothetical protein
VKRTQRAGAAKPRREHKGQGQPNLGAFVANREDWVPSRTVVNQSKIRWAIYMFKTFKSAGADENVPALLQQGTEHLAAYLCHIFRACLALAYIPTAWRQVKVMFIPKPGKANYTKAKACHPISLLSIMLKMIDEMYLLYLYPSTWDICRFQTTTICR